MKKTVFISSTFIDLASYRRAIWTLLEGFNVSVMGMEAFGARKETPLQTCLVEVEQSDIYVGIIGFRLGSIREEMGKSFTQIEYERAVELRKEILIYLADPDNARVAPAFVDRGVSAEKLDAFKAMLKDRHTVSFFTSEEDLAAKLGRDFKRLLVASETSAPEPNEFLAAQNLLHQFALAPRSTAGQQLRLNLKRIGAAFPASKTLCEAFNFEYGNAVAVPVEIVSPADCAKLGLDHVFASGKRVPDLLRTAQSEQFEIYVTTLFSTVVVERMRASFKSESYSYYETQNLKILNENSGLKHVTHQAEGTIGLLFTGSA